MRSFSDALHRLGLTHAQFARLVGVSPQQVRAWAASGAEIPGPVSAFLALLESYGAGAAADCAVPLADGIYAVQFEASDSEIGHATAALRKGAIFGSDREGGIFSGHYQFDATRNLNRIEIRFLVPPGGSLVTGFSAGPEGGAVDIVGEFGNLDTRPVIKLDIGREPLEVELNYLGPLPN
jgi:hypothetical protein